MPYPDTTTISGWTINPHTEIHQVMADNAKVPVTETVYTAERLNASGIAIHEHHTDLDELADACERRDALEA